jgi:hypothetical protein
MEAMSTGANKTPESGWKELFEKSGIPYKSGRMTDYDKGARIIQEYQLTPTNYRRVLKILLDWEGI